MGFIIFRLIIFVALIWAGIRILKIYNQKKLAAAEEQDRVNAQAQQSEQMVQCRYCNLHLPEKNAVAHEHLWFCCHEHRDHFLDHGPQKK